MYGRSTREIVESSMVKNEGNINDSLEVSSTKSSPVFSPVVRDYADDELYALTTAYNNVRSLHRESILDRLSISKERERGTKAIIYMNISRWLPIVAALLGVGYAFLLITNTKNWSTDPESSGGEKNEREANRGVLVSVILSVLLNVVGGFMFHINVREALVVTNYGFILSPIIGFMLDQAVGIDAGFRHAFTMKGVMLCFGSLCHSHFARYIITVFLDLFISNPLQDVLKRQASEMGIIEMLRDDTGKSNMTKKWDGIIAKNFPSILQSIVGFVTFNAYTNQTRFSWAYPDGSIQRDIRIPPGTIMLSTAIAAVSYLNFYTIMDYISERQYYDINTKVLYVIFVLAMLYILNQFGGMEAPLDEEGKMIDNDEDINWVTAIMGMFLFGMFVMYGFVYPIWTKIGFCGYRHFQPPAKIREADDHLIRDREASVRGQMVHEIRKDIQRMSRNVGGIQQRNDGGIQQRNDGRHQTLYQPNNSVLIRNFQMNVETS